MSLDLFVQDTGYETGDLVRVVVVTDQGTEVLLDAAGDDIEALEGLGTFQTLSVDLGAEVQSAQLIVELDSNASTEAIYVDNVVIEETPVVVPFGFTQSFETEATGAQYVNAATDGTALATGAIVDIENVAGLSTVDSTDASAGLLGFDAEWENTRSGVGLSDGDFVGVTDFTGTVGAFTDGTQGYQLSDADGLMRLRFDQIDTSGQGPVEVALDLFVQSTGWEADDLIRVVVETDQGTEVLLDTTGQDIDDLDIEGAFQTLSVVLGAEVNTAQLIVELDSNSGSEAIYVDNVVVREADPEPQPFAIAQSFEDEATGAQYSNAATDGTVLPADAEVDIENVPGLATVDSTEASAGSLGFNATWINSRGDVGLSDGDFVGVTSFTGTVGSYTDGIQGYQISDPDGLYRLTFDDIDLTAVGAVTVSLDYFLQSTGYESDDLFRVFVITDQGTQTLIDTSGQDIDDLGIEGAWTTLTADIDASVTSAQLVVEFDANSGSEAVYLDKISVATPVEPTGTSVGITADAPSVLEGDSGTTTVTFTVTRSGDVSGATDVDFAVGGDVDAADFGGTLPSGTVSFAADETTQTITVEITGDTTSEIDEALTVTLSNATGDATIATAQATTVVQNDDVEFATIAEIQGSGLSSARVGQTLQTTGIVTYIEPDGFYIQMAVGDGDDATSDGMFVFVGDDVLANNPIVAVGNEVEVIGTVSEFVVLTQL